MHYGGKTYVSTVQVKDVVRAYNKLFHMEWWSESEKHKVIQTLVDGGYTVEDIAEQTPYKISDVRYWLENKI